MRNFLRSVLGSGSSKEREQRLADIQVFDSEVERLDRDETSLLVRHLMTLARRRRCATNHLDENVYDERRLDWSLKNWYRKNGYADEGSALDRMSDDLEAIIEDPALVGEAIKKRIILTDYFSRKGKLEDHYSYGDINPFIFGNEDKSVSLRDTLFDRMDFPTRISTIISFDPEVRGHKHQIRYFRSLLVAYSLAHILNDEGVRNDSIRVLLRDERALANGWLAVAQRMDNFLIKPKGLAHDENFLYSQNKVYESAELFNRYRYFSEKILENYRII